MKLLNKYRPTRFLGPDHPARANEDVVSEVEGSATTAAQASAVEQLYETIDLICADAARAELWATALSAFAQPVPEYDLAVD